ncbi:hypothetical protein ACTXI4_17505 [Glutamicibacter ardleyensis]|uniref:hypothetical protein n=1 Tax=Glutamicibacter ardleyensis TaxID=225894 RepID=UPI003FD3A5A2
MSNLADAISVPTASAKMHLLKVQKSLIDVEHAETPYFFKNLFLPRFVFTGTKVGNRY